MTDQTRATEAIARITEVFNREVHSPEELEQLLAPDVVRHDGRRFGDQPVVGRDSYLERLGSMRDVGVRYALTPSVVATRGDTLVLIRAELRFDNGFVQEYLQVCEIDDQGRFSRLVFFDVDDDAAALAELDDRWSLTSTDDPPPPGPDDAS